MKILNWLLALVGIFGLIGVRMVEDQLFYDPFLAYFHLADKSAAFPEFEWGKLIVNYFFRFGLNLVFSALILQSFFHNKKWTLQGMVMMVIVFVISLIIYLYCIHTKFEVGYLFSFYMRRFVIQPLILLLIIPLFYYQKKIAQRN